MIVLFILRVRLHYGQVDVETGELQFLYIYNLYIVYT